MTGNLSTKYGLDAAEQGIRKQFLCIEPEDESRLKQLESSFQRIAPEFAAAFYRHLLSLPETAGFFGDAAAIERLKLLQMQYFQELLQGEYGDEYFEKRLRVGEVHQRLGVKPTWYLAAYNLFIQQCFPAFAADSGGALPAPLCSLIKLVLLDVGLALETYFAEGTEQLRRRNQELEHALEIYFEAEVRAQQYAKLAGHEIRGGLNAVGNVCEEVVDDFADKLPADVRRLLESARDRVWQMGQVVDQILSNPDRPAGHELIHTRTLLAEIGGRLKLHAGDRAICLTVPELDVTLWGDPVGLREVFANLVSNAAKHLDKPEGIISIEYAPTEQAHVFIVSDNGPGIPREWQDRIFQPFFRIPGSEARSGRGLGLYFVKRIVEQHGGKAWVESAEGRGSRFCFSLPRDSAPPSSRSPAQGAGTEA